MERLEFASSALECDCAGGIEAPVEADDEEWTRTSPPARRGGGGGGAFEAVGGGDGDEAPGPIITSSVIGVDRSEFAKDFGLS